MEARVKWIDGMTFMGESPSGHGIVMDARPEFGGRNLGPSPMEMMLMGAGGCTAIDVLSIIRKAREPVEDVDITLTAERADEIPKVFTKIHMHFTVKGAGVKEKTVERAINLSAEKYCSASIMLGKTAEITHSFEIV
ncbi:MAG: OsmC family protein [Rhodospirillales bacterium]|nr:OsmC family protein [Rhodospirillales bacterium]MCW8861475.1 OsmC family protein [Rhodospirillales bacterium]MCW9001197.1 OsmC family protein [Rhodospirillales bacterium]